MTLEERHEHLHRLRIRSYKILPTTIDSFFRPKVWKRKVRLWQLFCDQIHSTEVAILRKVAEIGRRQGLADFERDFGRDILNMATSNGWSITFPKKMRSNDNKI